MTAGALLYPMGERPTCSRRRVATRGPWRAGPPRPRHLPGAPARALPLVAAALPAATRSAERPAALGWRPPAVRPRTRPPAPPGHAAVHRPAGLAGSSPWSPGPGPVHHLDVGQVAGASSRDARRSGDRSSYAAASIAWSTSQTMSSRVSSPTETRTMSSRHPGPAQPSSSSRRWVVEAGWMISVLASPTLARCEHSSQASMKRRPASRPPRDAEGEDAPGAARQVALGRARYGAVGQARVAHPLDGRVALQELGHGERRCRRGGPCAARASRGPAAAGRR